MKDVMDAESQGLRAGAQEAKMPRPHSSNSKRRILPSPSASIVRSFLACERISVLT